MTGWMSGCGAVVCVYLCIYKFALVSTNIDLKVTESLTEIDEIRWTWYVFSAQFDVIHRLWDARLSIKIETVRYACVFSFYCWSVDDDSLRDIAKTERKIPLNRYAQ